MTKGSGFWLALFLFSKSETNIEISLEGRGGGVENFAFCKRSKKGIFFVLK